MNAVWFLVAAFCIWSRDPAELALVALMLFTINSRSRKKTSGLFFVAGSALCLLLFGWRLQAEMFFLRGVILAGVSARISVDLPKRFETIFREMKRHRDEMSVKNLKEKIRHVLSLVPEIPRRRSRLFVDGLVWLILIAPFFVLAGKTADQVYAAPVSDSGPAVLIVQTPFGKTRIAKPGRYVVRGATGTLVLQIDTTAAHIVSADCREQRCVKQGEIDLLSGRSIVCMPNRILIWFEPMKNATPRKRTEVDAWTG